MFASRCSNSSLQSSFMGHCRPSRAGNISRYVERERLAKFREKASKTRLIEKWRTTDQLAAAVALSLPQTMRTYPAVDWVRADTVANETVLSEINELRKENDRLAALVEDFQRAREPLVSDIAGLEESFEVFGKHHHPRDLAMSNWAATTSWRAIFAALAPKLDETPCTAP